MLNDLLELVRAGFTKQEIMELLGKEQPVPQPEPQPVPQPVPQLEPQPVPQPEPHPVPQPVPQPEPQPVPQPEPDFNQFLTLIRGEFDGLKKAVQVNNINTEVQPPTKSIDELADDALASIIMPKKG